MSTKKALFSASVVVFAAAVALTAVGGCGGKKDAPAVSGGTDAAAGTEPVYTVADGYTINQTFPGAVITREGTSDKAFNLRLPKVVHSKNPEIEKYYDENISNAKSAAEYYIGGGKNDMREVDEEFMVVNNNDVRAYDVREAHGAVSVVINDHNDYLHGLTFDGSGKTYTVEEILALYGTTLKEVDAAAGASGEHYFGDKTDIELDKKGFDDGVTIYGENSFTVVTTGDFRHTVIATIKDGKFTFKLLKD